MSIMRDHVESCTAELEEITQCKYTPSGAAVAQAEPDLIQLYTLQHPHVRCPWSCQLNITIATPILRITVVLLS